MSRNIYYLSVGYVIVTDFISVFAILTQISWGFNGVLEIRTLEDWKLELKIAVGTLLPPASCLLLPSEGLGQRNEKGSDTRRDLGVN